MNLAEYYPELIRGLPQFEGRFSAHKLTARNCDVLFATYTAGTKIEAHKHETENVGVITTGELLLTMDGETHRITAGNWYHVPAGKQHAAEFPADTAEIEFWFFSYTDTDNA
ncbi:MAG: cupin domain-containing protein [Proteobacteria bacterium]|nr:cupin domain-containing protein [Pseudomonadota bacterium]